MHVTAGVDGIQPTASVSPLPDDPPTTVVVVDDHELLRAGTRRILDEADGFLVVGEAGDGETAIRLVQQLRPDVVLVDIRLPTGNGIEVTRRILELQPEATVLILSAYDDEHYVQAALAAGVSGYLLKTLPSTELVRLIRAACEDPRGVVEVPTGSSAGSSDSANGACLTTREREVVRLVASGMANKQIARRLGISPRTVEGHLNHVFEKVHAGSRTELVRYALAHGLLVAVPAPNPTPAR